MLVLDLDTPGGRADAMEEIIRIIEHFPNPDATYSFVDPKALSAGAFLQRRHATSTWLPAP
ncbi:protein of unknown function [Methylacidimicrobium sp. AP8]|nr:protein of unknown function [Methylacidimicrobium sp. AP8]